jgi:hypothetical protein
MAPRDSSLDHWPRRPAVAKKVSSRQRFVTRLVMHILPASGHCQETYE